VNISRQVLFIMVLLVWHYTATCAGGWQDCCRRGENRSWPSVSVESVDSECWCLNNAIFYSFIMRLTVEVRVFILESYLKTMSYSHCRQSFFEKFRRQAPVKNAIAKMIKKFHETASLLDKNRIRRKSVLTPGISVLKWMDIISNIYCKYRLVV